MPVKLRVMRTFERVPPVLSFFLCLLCLFTPSRLSAQTTARITGLVSDPSGAVVADARVSLTNTQTGQQRIVSTNSDGLYVAVSLSCVAASVVRVSARLSNAEDKHLVLSVV